jgi:uncharacterized protein (DUF1786 family)
MKILAVDIGTGTQDIYLFDSRIDIENGFKLVLPSPTMMVYRKIKNLTRQQRPILLTGVPMGGGPCQWAAEEHVKAGFLVYATPSAAYTFNDDLSAVQSMGIQIIGEEEISSIAESRLCECQAGGF